MQPDSFIADYAVPENRAVGRARASIFARLKCVSRVKSQGESLGGSAVRWGACSAIAFAGFFVLWVVLSKLLDVGRGLDLTEEGLYLISADPPVRWATWRFPFGWHTQPLFAVVSFDIATFRTLGAFLLVVASTVLGGVTASTVLGSRVDGRWARGLALSATATAAGAASLLYYAPFLRTPSYNWLTLTGLTVATAAAVWGMRPLDHEGRASAVFDLRGIASAAVASAAIFAVLPAKPPSAAMGFALVTILMTNRGWIRAIRWAALVAGMVTAWLLVAVLTRLWPSNFATVFQTVLARPPQDERSTVVWALTSLATVPRTLAGALGLTEVRPFIVLLLGVAVIAAPIAARRAWLPARAIGVALVCTSALSIAGAPIPILNPNLRAMGWASHAIISATLLVLGAVLLARVGQPQSEVSAKNEWRTWILIAAVLAALPFAYAFGSDNGAFGQAAGASGLILLAAIVPTLTLLFRPFGWTLVALVLATTLVMVGVALASGRAHPYVNEDLALQRTPVTVGAHGSSVALAPEMAKRLVALRKSAAEFGWKPGTPLIDLTYALNPGYAYFLGARTPNTVMLTAFGFEGSRAIARANLGLPNEGFPFTRAWLLMDDTVSVSEAVYLEQSDVARMVGTRSGLEWPADYDCVRSGALVLWKPHTAIATPHDGGETCSR